MEARITILTPTYNRASLLPRLYESLCKQTYKDFEWVIVDDGSTDSTKDVVRKSIKGGVFPIHYYLKENGGKHTAVNLGVKVAKGELVFIADSDDMLVPNALQMVSEEYVSIANDDSFCGVCGLDCDLKGNIIGSGLSKNKIDANSLELRTNYGVTGDLKEVFKTSVMREFPFPEIKGERFCPEALVWNRIAQKYKLRYFNKVIYTADYQSTGISANIIKARMNSPIASMMTYQEMTEYDVPLIVKVKSAINYWRFRFCYHKRMDSNICVPVLRKVWNVFSPIAFLMHLRDVIMVRQ